MLVSETEIIPYNVTSPWGTRVLVVAPHPDDETLGCGGTIRLLAQSEKALKVVFLTSGDKADPAHRLAQRVHQKPHITDYSALREKEAQKALRVLGITDYEFMRFPDRGLADNYGAAFEYLRKIAEDFRPDAIYAPSMVELNPDHRVAAVIAMHLQRALGALKDPDFTRLVFYEVSTALRPNMLVDITATFGKKRQAVKKYRSQLKLINYLGHVTALNTFRSLTVQRARYVEAFWTLPQPATAQEVSNWLSYQGIFNLEHDGVAG